MTNNTFEHFISFENLYLAWRNARRGKARRAEVVLFELDLERQLISLRERLRQGQWFPAGYRRFRIYDRKPREICAAPFADRVVHHALMQCIGPLMEPALHPHCYACRTGKGVHRALRQYQRWARRYPYVLKLDIRQYFPSVNHGVLKTQLQRLITDSEIFAVVCSIIDSTPPALGRTFLLPGEDLVSLAEKKLALPIGNLTSQHWANLYLSGIDQWINHTLSCRAYLRYVDDLTLLSDSKSQLWHWRDAIADQLMPLGLELHPKKQQVLPTRYGVDSLGYRVFPDHIRLRRDAGFRYRRRLYQLARAYTEGRCDLSEVHQSVAAWLGHGRIARSEGLQRHVLASVNFCRGLGLGSVPSGVARGRVEQPTAEPTFREP